MIINNIISVINDNLCIGCGTCISICPKKCISLRLDNALGIWVPKVNTDACISCSLCREICPGIDADYISKTPHKWNSLFYHPLVGYYSYLALAFSKNKTMQTNGASGGMVMALLTYMLQERIIEGAIVTYMGAPPQCCEDVDEFNNPKLFAKAVIARTEDDLIQSQGSKYCPIPLGEIFRSVRSESGPLALVGLPCHIQAFKKWQNIDKKMSKKITYCFGLFCSRTPNFHATNHLLYNRKIDLKDINELNYRAGGKNLGHMSIKLKNGQTKKIPHLSFDYWGHMFSNFFMPYRCFLCPDKTAALADISFGDNWTGLWDQPRGTSTLVAREPKTLSLLQEMHKKNYICLYDIDLSTLILSQDLKNKAYIAPRKKIFEMLGKVTPEYGKTPLYCAINSGSALSLTKSFVLFLKCKLSKDINSYFLLNLIGKFSFMISWTHSAIIKIWRILLKIIKEIFDILSCLFIDNITPKEKTSKYKILMMGGYGSKDIGDEAMPHADILNLKKTFDNELEIVMLSPNPNYTQKVHKQRSIKDIDNLGFLPYSGIKATFMNIKVVLYGLLLILAAYLTNKKIHLKLWPSARNALNEIISSDIIFNVGGGNLNSIIPQELYKKGFIYLAAKVLNKSVIVSGQTIGPFQNSIDKFFARLCLNTVYLITFRDKNISYHRCRNIGITRPIMINAADDAMTIPIINKKEAKKILLTEIGMEWHSLESELTVAMNFKGSLKLFKRRGEFYDLSKECQLMAEIADKIVDNFNAKIVFIPTDYSLGVDDRELHLEIINKVKNKKYIKALNKEYNDIALKSLIGLFDVAIGSRYHFCVFAASMFIPYSGIASGIYQRTKLRGLSDLCDLSRCFVNHDMEFATIEDVWPEIEWVIKNRGIIKDQLLKVVPFLNEKSLYGVKEAIRLLQQNPVS